MTQSILLVEVRNGIAILTLNRPEKRNAMCDAAMEVIDAFFSAPPAETKAVVITGTAGHFCSGLDLAEAITRDAEATMRHSQSWHAVLEKVQFGGLPVVSAMAGAVIGFGLELAAATHVRVADPSAIFQLPEGRRGIFVGGGASVRVSRVIGADRMTEMMLTGRRYDAEEGLRLGLTHYVTEPGGALERALQLAGDIAANAPLSNYLMINALGHIQEMGKADGLFTESLCAALSQTSADAREGLAAFLQKREPKFEGRK